MEYSQVEAEMMTQFLKLNFPTKRVKSKVPNRVSKNWETVIILLNGDQYSVTPENKTVILGYLVSDLRKVFATTTENCYPIVKQFLNLP